MFPSNYWKLSGESMEAYSLCCWMLIRNLSCSRQICICMSSTYYIFHWSTLCSLLSGRVFAIKFFVSSLSFLLLAPTFVCDNLIAAARLTHRIQCQHHQIKCLLLLQNWKEPDGHFGPPWRYSCRLCQLWVSTACSSWADCWITRGSLLTPGFNHIHEFVVMCSPACSCPSLQKLIH